MSKRLSQDFSENLRASLFNKYLLLDTTFSQIHLAGQHLLWPDALHNTTSWVLSCSLEINIEFGTVPGKFSV
jgi:hypothetical protein